MKNCSNCGAKLRQNGTCPRCGGLGETLPVDPNSMWNPASKPMSDHGPFSVSDSMSNPVLEGPPGPGPKKKVGALIAVVVSAAVLIAGVIAGAIAISKLGKSGEESGSSVANKKTVCKHSETRNEYEPSEADKHTVKVFCDDEACAVLISEETQNCVDEDQNDQCDLCGAALICIDEDKDDKCDLCGETVYAEVLESDGFEYGVSQDGESCTILKYTDNEEKVVIPETLGDATVTAIAAYAFSEADEVVYVSIAPGTTVESYAFAECENLDNIEIKPDCVVEADAFADCKKLVDVNAYRGVTLDAEAFSGCENLRAGSYEETDPFVDVDVPDDFRAYMYGMDVEVGQLYGVYSIDGVIYCTLIGEDVEGWVVLDFPKDQDEIIVSDNAIWILADALKGVKRDTEITLGKDTRYAFDLYEKAVWKANANTFADAWNTSCYAASRINEEMGYELMVPTENLVRTAMEAVQLLSSENDVDGAALLDSHDVAWISAQSTERSDITDLEAALDDLIADYVANPTVDSPDSSSYGEEYDQIGVAVTEVDGEYYLVSFKVVSD